MKRCGFILLCALVVLCVLLAGCEGKTAERSEAGEVFAFCGGGAENFALRDENRRKNGHACNGQRAEFDVCENRRHDVYDTV